MRLGYGKMLITLMASTTVAGTAQAQVSDQQAEDQVEEVYDIEALIDSSATTEGAINTARSQVGEGDVSGAATTLERALIADPDSTKTRAYYIALMCLLDDRMAAEFELEKLAGADIVDADWANVEQACGSMSRPATAQ